MNMQPRRFMLCALIWVVSSLRYAVYRPFIRSYGFSIRTIDLLELNFMNEVAQVIGKPDLAPAAWVKRLVTLCDHAPATPFDVVQHVVEKELHRSLGEVFETFDPEPLGSASIAQVS